jgi:hypothetical protein
VLIHAVIYHMHRLVESNGPCISTIRCLVQLQLPLESGRSRQQRATTYNDTYRIAMALYYGLRLTIGWLTTAST